jgi:predicted component of type VI protein secretion system
LGKTMPPQLVALTEGPNILLDKPILLLGRHQECDIQLASRKISRRHCCIAQVNDYLVVRDLCSTNGVRINGVRVTEGCLKPGDELTIGSHRYQVQWNATEAAAARRAPALVGKEGRATGGGPFEDDDRLESCEDPIALPDVAYKGPVLPSSPVAPGEAPQSPPQAVNRPKPESLVLPEDLNLAPASDAAQLPPKPPG